MVACLDEDNMEEALSDLYPFMESLSEGRVLVDVVAKVWLWIFGVGVEAEGEATVLLKGDPSIPNLLVGEDMNDAGVDEDGDADIEEADMDVLT
jgi:hypothetical protein